MAAKIRVRFAPSPTGFMHLGSVKIALLNYLFARQSKGTFILRIEDTDANRNLEEAKLQIIKDLEWLDLSYDEGPLKGGPHAPYAQSERAAIYEEQLNQLINDCKVYRCFCTLEELENKREKQRAMGKPPRYDRTCLNYSDDKIKAKLVANTPFVWRFKINHDQLFEIPDMAKGTINFDMKNFGDFALTRHDGTCTFMFVNFIDDWLMGITHVIRGEDHLSNTAMQAALYDAFAVPLPQFWHQPIICNKEGEKLSKRDFGFSLEDLKAAGYLSEAISNYMATVGVSFAEEIQSLSDLVKNYDFANIHSTGAIRYDVDKLTWFNHKWITKIDHEALVKQVKPFLLTAHPAAQHLDEEKISYLVSKVKLDLKTLNDIGHLLAFYFRAPATALHEIEKVLGKEKAMLAIKIINECSRHLDNSDLFVQSLKDHAQKDGLKTKEVFGPLRYLITGSFEGIGMHDLLHMIDKEEIKKRLHGI